ncbi:hypothetical protein IQ272_04610 [Chroococcidiopsidales cyanobacterium LEGE 13417]|uniref:hypothetical protein n=1 Tax=Chroococcidiopsis sp. CCALA 051 TaxID=869949 RepID=UPI0011B262BB|nr:hypothetical protein [Chroococcidiopsis sp. CCALA 051]MBE9015436.1 hypothetical protein [Chroococcidiopsidales cyanobacterium LEGE 13417]
MTLSEFVGVGLANKYNSLNEKFFLKTRPDERQQPTTYIVHVYHIRSSYWENDELWQWQNCERMG